MELDENVDISEWSEESIGEYQNMLDFYYQESRRTFDLCCTRLYYVIFANGVVLSLLFGIINNIDVGEGISGYLIVFGVVFVLCSLIAAAFGAFFKEYIRTPFKIGVGNSSPAYPQLKTRRINEMITIIKDYERQIRIKSAVMVIAGSLLICGLAMLGVAIVMMGS